MSRLFCNFSNFQLSLLQLIVEAIQDLVENNPKVQMDRAFLSLIPNEKMDEFWLPLRAFDYSANGKNGCGGLSKKRSV